MVGHFLYIKLMISSGGPSTLYYKLMISSGGPPLILQADASGGPPLIFQADDIKWWATSYI